MLSFLHLFTLQIMGTHHQVVSVQLFLNDSASARVGACFAHERRELLRFHSVHLERRESVHALQRGRPGWRRTSTTDP